MTILDPGGINALAYVQAFLLSRGGGLRIASSNREVTTALRRAGMESLLAASVPSHSVETVG